jgi:hypothetical protein
MITKVTQHIHPFITFSLSHFSSSIPRNNQSTFPTWPFSPSPSKQHIPHLPTHPSSQAPSHSHSHHPSSPQHSPPPPPRAHHQTHPQPYSRISSRGLSSQTTNQVQHRSGLLVLGCGRRYISVPLHQKSTTQNIRVHVKLE